MLVDIPDEWCADYAARWEQMRVEQPDKDVRPYQYPSEFRVRKGCYHGILWEEEIGDHLVTEYPWDPLFMFREQDFDDFDDCFRARMDELRRQWDLDYPFEVPPSYGMVDDFSQILVRWPQIEESFKKLIVVGQTISKEAQGNQGFRFHKNGEYYGTQRCLGYEYFGDEPYMGDVILFHIWEVQ